MTTMTTMTPMTKADSVQKEMEERNLRPRLCYLTKGECGYGFHLHGERSSGAQFIRRIEAGSPAELAGLRSGDRVVEVNGENVEKDSHQQASTAPLTATLFSSPHRLLEPSSPSQLRFSSYSSPFPPSVILCSFHPHCSDSLTLSYSFLPLKILLGCLFSSSSPSYMDLSTSLLFFISRLFFTFLFSSSRMDFCISSHISFSPLLFLSCLVFSSFLPSSSPVFSE